MPNKSQTQSRVALSSEQGQLLPWVAFLMVCLLGIGGLSIDVGRAFAVRQALQNSASAAALAASGQVYSSSSTSQAQTIATNYSGSMYNNVPGANAPIIKAWCVNMLMPTGETCTTSSPPNAVKVTESAAVPTLFMRVLGKNTLNVTVSAVASMRGPAQPWNVAIILDATSSMGNAPPAGSCTGFSSAFACAQNGVQTLLRAVDPCTNSTCAADATTNLRVSLFSFPNVPSSNVSKFWSGCTTPSSVQYTFPATNLASYSPVVATTNPLAYATSPTVATTYEDSPINSSNGAADGDANGFVVNYYLPSSSSPQGLNGSSSLVKEVTGCLSNPGGQSTYYAGVIYAAQAALTAEQALYPKSQNSIIILTDGDANATSTSNLASGAPKATAGGAPATDYLQLLTGSSVTSTSYYPAAKDECQQAIKAAQVAQAAGTKVFTIAFSSSDTGCSSDTDHWAAATSGQTLSYPLTPCQVMKNMASPGDATVASYFYADTTTATKNGCADTAHSTKTIADIFASIGSTYIAPGLLPPNAAGVELPSF